MVSISHMQRLHLGLHIYGCEFRTKALHRRHMGLTSTMSYFVILFKGKKIVLFEDNAEKVIIRYLHLFYMA
jgi:hypothetical protein